MIDFNLDYLSSRYFDNSSAQENDTAINYNIGKIRIASKIRNEN